jgi:hypothetical protein
VLGPMHGAIDVVPAIAQLRPQPAARTDGSVRAFRARS